MDLLNAISVIFIALAVAVGPSLVLAILAVRFGVDSRPGVGDDHRASTRRASL